MINKFNKLMSIAYILSNICIAAGMGKTAGKVIDNNGDPLIGVNIIVENTELGSVTDNNGEYFITFVPVGIHRVTASYIGYSTVSREDVIVILNQTINVDFQMDPTSIEMEAIIVSAEKPMIIRSQTQTERSITAADISALPISEINEIINLQAGVSTSKLGIHIRGGRSSEIAYYIDGVLTKSPHYGTQSISINKEAVEEINIATGGFDAEYGEALSGVVNVTTREGTEKLSSTIRYTTDELFTTDRLNYGYNLFEISAGGSALQRSRLRYYISGEAMRTDCNEIARYKVSSERFDYKLGGKLSQRLPHAKGKLTLTGFHSREQFMNYQRRGDMSFIFNLDHNTGETIKNNLLTLTFNYLPTQTSMIEGKLAYTNMTHFIAVRDLAAEIESNRRWYEDYMFKARHFPEILRATDDDSVRKWYLVDSLMNYYEEWNNSNAASLRHNPYGATGLFYTVGDNRMWSYLFNNDIQGLFSITNSIGKIHELKTGINITHQQVGWFDNELPWVSTPFWDMYDKNPLRIAAYIQDRMDFQGIIARIGVRCDYFDSKASGLANPSDPGDTTMIIASPKLRITPRIGFSMPITDRSKLRFNYGHFIQTPRAQDLYRLSNPAVLLIVLHTSYALVGNPDLTAEKTVAYEMSYENQISDVYVLGFTVYYKDIFDLVQTRRYVALPFPYYMMTNVDYGNVRGIEFIQKKQLKDYWSMSLSYTLQYAKGTASDPWQHYYLIYATHLIDPISGEFKLPKIDYWLDFDERHIINATLGIAFPEDFKIAAMRDFRSDFIFSYHSGFPYTPRNHKGDQIGEFNSERMSGYINVDANIAKDIAIAGLKFTISSQLYNVCNTEQIVYVYEQTGKPDTDGGEAAILLQDFSPISMSSRYYTPQADYDHDGLNSTAELYSEYIAARNTFYNNPLNWKPGFRMRVGISIKI